MMTIKTFGEYADDYANNARGEPWFDARHAHLNELLRAFWLGNFEDAQGNTQLLIDLTGNERDQPYKCTREFMFRVLPTGALWMPAEIRRSDWTSPPYHLLAQMQPRQYEQACRLLMERIIIDDQEYRRWRRANQKPEPPTDTSLNDQAADIADNCLARSAPPGRPSMEPEIKDACRQLIESGKAVLDSRSENYELIRHIIRTKRGLSATAHISGLGDEAIRKVIAPMLDEEKAEKPVP